MCLSGMIFTRMHPCTVIRYMELTRDNRSLKRRKAELETQAATLSAKLKEVSGRDTMRVE